MVLIIWYVFFHKHFRKGLSVSLKKKKKLAEICMRITLNLHIKLRKFFFFICSLFSLFCSVWLISIFSSSISVILFLFPHSCVENFILHISFPRSTISIWCFFTSFTSLLRLSISLLKTFYFFFHFFQGCSWSTLKHLYDGCLKILSGNI